MKSAIHTYGKRQSKNDIIARSRCRSFIKLINTFRFQCLICRMFISLTYILTSIKYDSIIFTKIINEPNRIKRNVLQLVMHRLVKRFLKYVVIYYNWDKYFNYENEGLKQNTRLGQYWNMEHSMLIFGLVFLLFYYDLFYIRQCAHLTTNALW